MLVTPDAVTDVGTQTTAEPRGGVPMWSAHEWLPTAAHLRFLRERPNDYLNAILYKMCDDARDHRDLERVRAKVVIVGRSYATGLLRHIDGGEARVARLLVSQRRWLDRDIANLRIWADHEPRRERIETIARVHGHMLHALKAVTRAGNSVRSFVAKYLHFHARVVPIFDQYAFKELTSWYKRVPTGNVPPDVDKDYWKHAVRHAWIVENWTNIGLRERTSRAIDDYAIACWYTTKR